MARGSKAKGAGWEVQLRSWHRAYRAAGLAHVIKTEPPVKVIRMLPKGRFTGVYLRKGPVDFVGLTIHGPVAFDAKHTDSAWTVSSMLEHQRKDLDRWAALGAFAFVALQCPQGQFVLPWAVVRESSGAVDPLAVGIRMDDQGWLSCLPL